MAMGFVASAKILARVRKTARTIQTVALLANAVGAAGLVIATQLV